MQTCRESVSLGCRGLRGLFVSAVACLFVVSAAAQAQSVEFDDWANFKPGSWSKLRTTTQTLNEQGDVVSESVSTAHYQLAEVTGDLVKLDIAKGTVEYEGKQFPTPAATLVVRQYGQTQADKIEIVEQPKEKLEVGIDRVECRSVKALLSDANGSREVVTLFRDAAVTIPVRRVVRTFDSKGESIDTTTTDAWAMNVPHRLGNELLPTTHYRTLYRNHKLSSTAVSIKSAAVPGQLVHSTIAERDASDRLLRYTVQELVSYGGPDRPTRATMISERTIGERAKERREAREERQEQRRDSRRGRR
jgi:hypothetical protein